MKVLAPEKTRVRTTNYTNDPGSFWERFRPRFLDELVVVPFNDEIIVEGTERLQAIDDTTENGVLLDLIGLMNGDRTLDELQSALPGTSEEDLLETISSLRQFGFVEDGAVGSETECSNPDTLSFLRRHVGVTGANWSGAQACQRLLKSEVLVFSSDDGSSHGKQLRDLLTTSGVGQVLQTDRTLPAAWRQHPSVTQSIAISLSFGSEDPEWNKQLDDWCFKNDLPWLRFVFSNHEGYVDFGPIFFSERTPCYQCFLDVHAKTHSGRCFTQNELQIEATYWTGLAAVELIYFLSRVAPLTTERYVERYDLQQHTSQRLSLLRVPGCSRCRPMTNSSGGLDAAIAFEDYITLPARPRIPSVVQEDYVLLSSVLLTQTKRMPNSAHVLLPPSLARLEQPALEVLDQSIKADHHVITVDDLSTMLLATAGIRESDGQKVQRWTATAGNLGSVELFVIVHHVDGLKPGIYFYQSDDHSLAYFRQHNQTLTTAALMPRVALIDSPAPPDAVIVLTGAYHRLERKYGDFAYKLVNLDAGVAAGQLHFVAKSLGLSSLTASCWADDLLEHYLNLEERQEQVTDVVGLYAATPAQPVASTAGSPSNASQLSHHAADFCELQLRDVGERLFRESRVDEQKFRLSTPSYAVAHRAAPRGSLSLLPPPKIFGGPATAEVLAQRTTVRNYGDAEVSPDELSTLLHSAHRGDREQWPEQHLAHPLTFYVLAWKVADLKPAVYTYDPEEHGLRFVAPARSYQESMNLFVQPEFASAALVIWITGNLAAASDHLGPLGHRYLLVRAGSAGHRLWTAALAMNLAGAVTAGVVSGIAREQFGIDGYNHVSLLAFATGVAAEDDEPLVDGESE